MARHARRLKNRVRPSLRDRASNTFWRIMLDKTFAKWWLSRVVPFRDVATEKLAAEREAMSQQQEYNRNYAEFLNGAVLPAIDAMVKVLGGNDIRAEPRTPQLNQRRMLPTRGAGILHPRMDRQ